MDLNEEDSLKIGLYIMKSGIDLYKLIKEAEKEAQQKEETQKEQEND